MQSCFQLSLDFRSWTRKYIDYIVLTSESVIGDHHVDLHQSPTFDARHRICPLRKGGKFPKVPFDLFRSVDQTSNAILMTNRHIILVTIFSISHIRNNRMRASGAKTAKTESRRISHSPLSSSPAMLSILSLRDRPRESRRGGDKRDGSRHSHYVGFLTVIENYRPHHQVRPNNDIFWQRVCGW